MLIFSMLIRGKAYPGIWIILLFTFNKAAWPLRALLGCFLCLFNICPGILESICLLILFSVSRVSHYQKVWTLVYLKSPRSFVGINLADQNLGAHET